MGVLLSGKFWDPAKCSPPPQVILHDVEPMSSTGLSPWASARGGEPSDPEGLGSTVEGNHLSGTNRSVPGRNTADLLRAQQTVTGGVKPIWTLSSLADLRNVRPPPHPQMCPHQPATMSGIPSLERLQFLLLERTPGRAGRLPPQPYKPGLNLHVS